MRTARRLSMLLFVIVALAAPRSIPVSASGACEAIGFNCQFWPQGPGAQFQCDHGVDCGQVIACLHEICDEEIGTYLSSWSCWEPPPNGGFMCAWE